VPSFASSATAALLKSRNLTFQEPHTRGEKSALRSSHHMFKNGSKSRCVGPGPVVVWSEPQSNSPRFTVIEACQSHPSTNSTRGQRDLSKLKFQKGSVYHVADITLESDSKLHGIGYSGSKGMNDAHRHWARDESQLCPDLASSPVGRPGSGARRQSINLKFTGGPRIYV